MVAGPLTIVQMVPELESGGVERGTLELGKYLVQQGHRSIVISGGGRLVDQLVAEGSEHVQWDVGRKNPLTLRYVPKLKKFLTGQKVDILHLRSRVPAWVGYLAWKRLPARSRPRLVTTFHGFYSINRYSSVMARGERIIAISRIIAEHIKEVYRVAPDRIEIIYRGVDNAKFNPYAVEPAKKDTLLNDWKLATYGAPVIMLPGRLTRLKGHDVFIKALNLIKDLEWSAVCIGDTEDNSGYLEELQKLLRGLRLEDRVKFVGHCDNMPAAYMLADIVVSATSTRPEAFGRIAVEAQAMERPVIASAQGGSLETVLPGKTGWLVEPGNPESLARALREAVQDPALCLQYGKSGREWVLKSFTTEKMCTDTVHLYHNLLLLS